MSEEMFGKDYWCNVAEQRRLTIEDLYKQIAELETRARPEWQPTVTMLYATERDRANDLQRELLEERCQREIAEREERRLARELRDANERAESHRQASIRLNEETVTLQSEIDRLTLALREAQKRQWPSGICLAPCGRRFCKCSDCLR